eukprot:IDg10089t1
MTRSRILVPCTVLTIVGIFFIATAPHRFEMSRTGTAQNAAIFTERSNRDAPKSVHFQKSVTSMWRTLSIAPPNTLRKEIGSVSRKSKAPSRRHRRNKQSHLRRQKSQDETRNPRRQSQRARRANKKSHHARQNRPARRARHNPRTRRYKRRTRSKRRHIQQRPQRPSKKSLRAPSRKLGEPFTCRCRVNWKAPAECAMNIPISPNASVRDASARQATNALIARLVSPAYFARRLRRSYRQDTESAKQKESAATFTCRTMLPFKIERFRRKMFGVSLSLLSLKCQPA